MQTTKIVAGVLFAGAAFQAYQSYQNATRYGSHPLAPLDAGPSPTVTPANCMTVRQAENLAFREYVIASGLALGGLYLWMRR